MSYLRTKRIQLRPHLLQIQGLFPLPHLPIRPRPKDEQKRGPHSLNQVLPSAQPRLSDFIAAPTHFAPLRIKLPPRFHAPHGHQLLVHLAALIYRQDLKVYRWSAKCAPRFAIWNRNCIPRYRAFAVEHSTVEGTAATHQIRLQRSLFNLTVLDGSW